MQGHRCDAMEREQSEGVIIFDEDDQRWKICIEDRGDWEKINFCPYCGLEFEAYSPKKSHGPKGIETAE